MYQTSEELLDSVCLKERQVAVFTVSCEIRGDTVFLRCSRFFTHGGRWRLVAEMRAGGGNAVIFESFTGCFYMCPVAVGVVLNVRLEA